MVGKGILKRHESPELVPDLTLDSNSKHVKWDEEKLKVSEAIKMTIPKGQIDEPKTPFQHGEYCTSLEDENFNLKGVDDDTEEGSVSDSSFRRASITSTGSSTGWESSLSEFETDTGGGDEEPSELSEEFKCHRAHHYFMKQALQRGKELIETDEDEDEEI